MKSSVFVSIIFLLALSISFPTFPATAQDLEIEYWTLPGEGAGGLVVNPADGSLWVFQHQSQTLAALDTSDGSVILEVPLTLRTTAMEFTPEGSRVFLVGEPLDDQIIDRGLIQAIDTSDGSVIGQMELEGAVNAIHVESAGTIYVATGMQYAYNGTLYKLAVSTDESGNVLFDIESLADCGKIPWAIATFRGTLYVTDYELQWTAQADGSMGPPYGAWVWSYDAFGLADDQPCWVGINPSRMEVMNEGVLVACTGCKQSEGSYVEPTMCLIEGPGESRSIYIDTAGASDIAVSPDGGWAVATLADWGPPASGSALAIVQNMVPGVFSDVRRWIYTGDIALINVTEDGISTERIEIIPESFVRAVAISSDGERIFLLEGEDEQILVLSVDSLRSGG